MPLIQIALGIFLAQAPPAADREDAVQASAEPASAQQMAQGKASAPAAAAMEHGQAHGGASPAAEPALPRQAGAAAAEAVPLQDAPRPISYLDVPLFPLCPPALPAEAADEQPAPPARRHESARRPRPYPRRHLATTVHFAEAAGEMPYAVLSTSTGESCVAPCALRVPAARNRFVFQAGDRTFARKFNLAGPEQSLRLERAGNSGMVAGGALLVSAGIAVDLGFLFISPIVFSNFDGTERAKYGQWAIAAGISSAITGALLTTGIILIAKGKPKVSKTLALSADAGEPSPLDTLSLALAPTREGIAASAALRF